MRKTMVINKDIDNNTDKTMLIIKTHYLSIIISI